MKKFLSLLLLFVFLLLLVACGGQQAGGTDSTETVDISVPTERQYTIWIRAGEKFYVDYNENPGLEYVETLSWGKDENGQDKYLDFSVYIPVSGAETDNFNTLIGTGEYMDVMNSDYSARAIDLYNDGITMDITEYVESYMPNYLAFLDANPHLEATSKDLVDGERRYLSLKIYSDEIPEMWGGWLYRRDWIVKYGQNPIDGSAFSGEFTVFNEDSTPDPDSWEDNVIFPSGGPDPIYISDWEWMFEIFDTAMEDLGITDGYGMSLYYPGYLQVGDLISAFGWGGSQWYKTPENEIIYGATTDGFRTYLQAMNTWYANGWIDKAFTEHATDMFYTIDPSRLYSGKVGLWWGSMSSLGARLNDPSSPYLDGFVSFTAAQPINDIYGSADEQNKEPTVMYQPSQEGPTYVITTSAEDKDLETLFTFLDYLYTEQGAVLRTFGLSKEQYEVTQNKFMTENGYTEGAYTKVVDEDGVERYLLNKQIQDAGHQSAVAVGRFPGLQAVSLGSHSTHIEGYNRNVARLVQYQDTGTLQNSFINLLADEDYATYNKINTNLTEFLTRNVSPFIKGDKDPFSDDDWNAFVNALNKYGPDKVTVMFQAIADSLYSK